MRSSLLNRITVGSCRRDVGRLLIACALLLACVVAHADATGVCPRCPPSTELTAAQAKEDVQVLKRALAALHPALTKYRSATEIDVAFAAFEQRGHAARSAADLYLAATELAAAVRCGHTWTNVLNQHGAARAALLDPANKLPVQMKLVQGRWLVRASADASITRGDEILAVDGVPAKDMVERLMPYLRADGSSDGKRLRQLDHDRGDYSQIDILWPLLEPPTDGIYRLTVRRNSGSTAEVRVAAHTLAARRMALAAQGAAELSQAWSFNVEGNLGVLVMPTWSFWRSDFDTDAFIEQAFARLTRNQVPNLVIDLRANEGGDGAIGHRLLSHLLDEPITIARKQNITRYERVPYSLARYLDTWDFSFFDRTGDVQPIAVGVAAGSYRVESKAAMPSTITPSESRYAGRVFVLIGAENSSATFSFADLVKRSKAATLVGQRTGGNQRGLNGGQVAWVTAPNSGVAIDIPLLAGDWNASTPDTGVEPDIVVEERFDAQRSGRDLEREAVRRAIAGDGSR
ncbi:MAG: S41 family peptidase [Dokdonella sp.]